MTTGSAGAAVVYVDTSALGALLVDQPESETLAAWLDDTSAVLVSSDLLGDPHLRSSTR